MRAISRANFPLKMKMFLVLNFQSRRSLFCLSNLLALNNMVWFLLVSILLHKTLAFSVVDSVVHSASPPSIKSQRSSLLLNLLPLSTFMDEITFFSESDELRGCIDTSGNFKDKDNNIYELCLVEEQDIPDLCRFVIASFGADSIRLSQDMNSFEKALLSPATELLNGYSTLVAFAEVFSGTNQRLTTRLEKMDISPPNLNGLATRQEMIDAVEKDSLILALAKDERGTKEIIASIELRLQPCDAKIPFSLPWLDRIERKIAATAGIGTDNGDLQPYLSNLCVDESFRGQKIGRSLVRVVENIAQTAWGFSRIYLHVDEDNIAALSLYCSEDYQDVGHRWRPFWAGSAADIGYYVKTMKRK